MDTNKHSTESSLFLVRLWSEQTPEGEPRWSGKVQQVVTGESHVFHSWPEMVSAMQGMLPDAESEPQADTSDAAPAEETRSPGRLARMFTR
jgi:hypothetical protein